MINDLVISQIRQRLEILYQMVDELETGGGGGQGGVTDYNDLTSKPKIGGVTLQGDKTAASLGLATSTALNTLSTTVTNLTERVGDLFAVDNVNISQSGVLPAAVQTRVTAHEPINVNSDQYYFVDETGVDYLYANTNYTGAFPSITYLRIMKNSWVTTWEVFATTEQPVENSNNFVTSGGVYSALQEKIDSEEATDISFGLGTIIPNNTDWDTLTDIGNYYVASSTNIATMINAPTTGVGGRLEVTTANATAHRFQKFYASSATVPRVYIRALVLSSGNLVWSDWKEYRDLDFTLTRVFGLGTTIPANSDLDTYNNIGIYSCGASTAATLTNSPVTIGFRLEVVQLFSTTRRQQRLYPQDPNNGAFYIRTEGANGFGSWFKFEGTIVS